MAGLRPSEIVETKTATGNLTGSGDGAKLFPRAQASL